MLIFTVQAANEVWRTKPFEQWTKADVKQILYDSPWVKRELVPTEWISKAGMEEAPSMSGGGVYSTGTSAASIRQPIGTPSGQAAFVVQWASSRTLREALIRQGEFDGQIKESEESQYLAGSKDLQITVQGPDMRPFEVLTPGDLMSNAVLRGKQSGVKVTATNIDLQQSGGYLSAVVFTFPRKTSDGMDVLSPNEKAIQFSVKVKNLDLGATFDPRKMVDIKGPDF
ncbi:MAG TPA: hypothetical protein VN745_02470 [Verrucomicrobiae bacterium]|nr:hypothetical protein [Verrucomicrobiae bacterium]